MSVVTPEGGAPLPPEHRFIGRGWRFPIKVDARGAIGWSEGPDRIRDAIWLVLNTGLGERVMRPTFGAGVHDYVFQPNTPATRTALAEAIRQALVRWEPRIEVDAVRVDPVPGEPSQVLAAVEYRIRRTNELFNVVWPFYLQEGVG
jgi:phage baseplate assembly protein W